MNVRAESIAITLGGSPILRDMDIRAEAREFVGIIGPNGSGKSTLLKCIYRVLKPDCGTVYMDDEPLSRLSVRESAKRTAVVSQHNHYSFEFSVREIVLMGRAPHKRLMEKRTRRKITTPWKKRLRKSV